MQGIDAAQDRLGAGGFGSVYRAVKAETGEVTAVKFTGRLTDSPCIVTSTLSPHLRKMMKNMMQGQGADPSASMPCTMEVQLGREVVKFHLRSRDLQSKNTSKREANYLGGFGGGR